jgi:hypothetical protein
MTNPQTAPFPGIECQEPLRWPGCHSSLDPLVTPSYQSKSGVVTPHTRQYQVKVFSTTSLKGTGI